MAALASDWLRHFPLLLWNRWTEFNETWQEERSQRPLPSLCFLGRSEKQDGRPGQSVKKVAHCTQVHDMWPFGPLVLFLDPPMSLSRYFCCYNAIFSLFRDGTRVCSFPNRPYHYPHRKLAEQETLVSSLFVFVAMLTMYVYIEFLCWLIRLGDFAILHIYVLNSSWYMLLFLLQYKDAVKRSIIVYYDF